MSAILNPFRLPFEAHQAVEVSDDLSADWVPLLLHVASRHQLRPRFRVMVLQHLKRIQHSSREHSFNSDS